jgi:exodeoxyribonuclease VII small subunit
MTDKAFNFEHALKELEEITLWFESSDVDLDAGLVKFERGMELADQLKVHLTAVENRVEKIKQRFSNPVAAAPEVEAGSVDTTDYTDSTDQTGLFQG